jgi:hypothetical protein
VKIKGVAHPPTAGAGVEQQARAAEVDLDLGARWARGNAPKPETSVAPRAAPYPAPLLPDHVMWRPLEATILTGLNLSTGAR